MAKFDDLIEAQIDGATIRAAGLVKFDFKSGLKRYWQGSGTLDAGGEKWLGVGNLGAIEPIQSGPRGAVEEITLSLFGGEGLLANIEADAGESVGREVNLYLQFFDIRRTDDAGNWVDWQPIADMLSLFWGRMGPMSVKRQAAGAEGRGLRSISVTVQNAMTNRRRPPLGFFSNTDQRERGSSSDQICIRISEFAEKTVRWPVF